MSADADGSSGLENFPDEIVHEITHRLPLKTLAKLCKSSKRLSQITCHDSGFWVKSGRLRGPVTDEEKTIISSEGIRGFYLVIHSRGKVAEGSEEYIPIHKVFVKSGEMGDENLIEKIIAKYKSRALMGISFGLGIAGNYEMFEAYRPYKRYINQFLRGVGYGASIENIHRILDIIMDERYDIFVVYHIMEGAAINSRIDILKDLTKIYDIELTSVLEAIGMSGNPAMIEFAVGLYPDSKIPLSKLNLMMASAGTVLDFEMMKLLHRMGGNFLSGLSSLEMALSLSKNSKDGLLLNVENYINGAGREERKKLRRHAVLLDPLYKIIIDIRS